MAGTSDFGPRTRAVIDDPELISTGVDAPEEVAAPEPVPMAKIAAPAPSAPIENRAGAFAAKLRPARVPAALPVQAGFDPRLQPMTSQLSGAAPAVRDFQRRSEANATDYLQQQNADRREEFEKANAEFQREAITRGAQTYSESGTGVLRQKVDEQGRPLFQESSWSRPEGKTARPGVLTRRNELGETEEKPARLRMGRTAADPYLYYDYGNGQLERAGHVDDLAESTDETTAATAKKWQAARQKAVIAAGRQPLVEHETEAKLSVVNARQELDGLNSQLAEINGQIAAIPAEAEEATEGGFLGIGAKPTAEAQAAKAKRAALEERAQQLGARVGELSGKLETKPGMVGDLVQAQKAAELEREAFDLQAKRTQWGEASERRAAGLREQGKNPEKDEIYLALKAKEAEFGQGESELVKRRTAAAEERKAIATSMEAARIERRKVEDAEKLIVQQQGDAPAEGVPADKKAEALQAERETLTADSTTYTEAVKTFNERQAKREFETPEAAQAEADRLNEMRATLIQRTASFGGAVDSFNEKIEGAKKERQKDVLRGRIAAARGRELFELKQSIGAELKERERMEGTRGEWSLQAIKDTWMRDGRALMPEQKAQVERMTELERDPVIAEAARYHAFASGESMGAAELYAKGAGGAVVLNPDTMKPRWGAPGEDTAPDWRAAVSAAVEAGDLKPDQAERMTQKLEARESLVKAATQDHVMDKPAFQRWVKSEHPELAESAGFFASDLVRYRVPWGDPKLRTAVDEWMSKEPGVAQKAWNSAMSGISGVVQMGVETARFAGTLSNAAANLLRENEVPVEENPLHKLGDTFTYAIDAAADPRLSDRGYTQISQALGSSVGFAIPAATVSKIATGANLGPVASRWLVGSAVAGMGGAVNAQGIIDEAKAAGWTDDEALTLAPLGFAVGMSELAPIMSWADRLGGKVRATAMKRFVGNLLKETLEETGQELGQTGANNLIAQTFYDENRDLFEGADDAVFAAGGSAPIMTALTSLVGGIRMRKALNQQQTVLGELLPWRQQGEAAVDTLAEIPELSRAVEIAGEPVEATEIRARHSEALKGTREAIASGDPEAQLEAQAALIEAERALGGVAVRQLTRIAQTDIALKEIELMPDYQAQEVGKDGQAVDVTVDPATARDAARALVRVAGGAEASELTAVENAALETVAKYDFEDGGAIPFVRAEKGGAVITDRAAKWMADNAPEAAKLIEQTEAQRLEELTRGEDRAATREAAQAERVKKTPVSDSRPDEPSKKSDKVATSKPGLSVSFTGASGARTVDVPANATISTGERVTNEATAAQWLSEGGVRDARDIQVGERAVKAENPKAAPGALPTEADVRTAIDRVADTAAGPLAKALTPDRRTAAAKQLAKKLGDAVEGYRAVFGADGVVVNEGAAGSGGVALQGGKLQIYLGDLVSPANLPTLLRSDDRLAKLVQEEAIHKVAVDLIPRADIEAIWRGVGKDTQAAVKAAYEREGQAKANAYQLGHELLRMIVQGRLKVEDGRFSLDGRTSEQTLSRGILDKIAEVLARIQAYFAETAERLRADGADEAAAKQVEAAAALIEQRLRESLGITSTPAQAEVLTREGAGGAEGAQVDVGREAGVSPAPVSTPEVLEGEKIDREWTAFAPESGSVGVPRAEMPQVKSEARGALTQFLLARGIVHEQAEVLPGTLKPTQAEFSPAKVAKAVANRKEFGGQGRAILVSSDNHVVDGHHQWIAALEAAPTEPMRIIRFNAPIASLLEQLAEFPSTELADGATATNSPASVESRVPSVAAPVVAQAEGGGNISQPPVSASDKAQAQTASTPEPGPVAGLPLATGGASDEQVGPRARIVVNDRGEIAPGSRKQLASELGISIGQLGTVEKVTHKGRTYWTANVVIDAGRANTSHDASGRVNEGYPQALQPRNRADRFYRQQQAKIAGRPNLDEEAKSGSPDSGPPIMAIVEGRAVTVIGNGRANAKALMYAERDFEDAAQAYPEQLARVGVRRGILPSVVREIERPTLARVIIEPMTMAELREVSKESNEFAGAQTNAVEQAAADADALTPAVLAAYEPEFGLMAAKNAPFRAEFVRAAFGEQGANLTEREIERRLQLALFAKAYGGTAEGQAAFMRLAGESEDSAKNITNALFALAPEIAAMKQRIADGTLHPLDISQDVARAAQDIGSVLRDRPAGQTVDAALDGLIQQDEMDLGGNVDGMAKALTEFLVTKRRSRVALESGLKAYVAGVYAAGDPKQADLFGDDVAPTREAIWQTARDADSLSSGQAGDVSAWKDSIKAMEAGTYDVTRPISYGRTPAVLRGIGVEEMPVYILPSVVKKVMGAHEISALQLRTLHAAMENPVAIFTSDTVEGSLVVMLDRVDSKGRPVLVIVKPEGTVDNHLAHVITSIYGNQDNARIARWLSEGRALFENKQKSQQWFRAAGLLYPSLGSSADQGQTGNLGGDVNPELRSGTAADTSPAQLVQDNLGLATDIARRYFTPANASDHGDIVQQARVALINAARKFEPARGVPFANYAGRAIRNAMNDLYGATKRISKREVASLNERLPEGGERGDLVTDEVTPRPSGGAEAEESRRLLEQAIAALAPRPQEIVRRVIAGENFTEIAASINVSKQAVQKMHAAALGLMREHLQNAGARGIDGADAILMSTPDADEEATIRDLMAQLDALIDQDAMTQNREMAELEQGTETKTIGRPDLANPAESEGARQLVNAVDETRKLAAERQSHEEWRKQAVEMLRADRDGVKRRLLEVAQDPQFNGLATAVDVKAAQLLVNELTQRAVTSKDTQALREAQILTYAYREGGTEQARAFAARHDPFKSPVERNREFLASVMFRPSVAVRKQIQKAVTPAEKSRMLDEARRKMAEAQAAPDADTKEGRARFARLKLEYGNAQKLLDKTQLLLNASNERMAKLEKTFEKMGLSLADIFQGEAYLRLRGAKVLDNYAEKLDANRKKAFKMLRRGATWDEVSKGTQLKPDDIDKVVADFRAEFMRKNLAKFLGGMKAEDVDVDSLGAGPAGGSAVTEAQARAEMEKALAMMGFGRDQREKNERQKKFIRRRRQPVDVESTRVPDGAQPGDVPSYPGDATGRPPADIGNHQIELGEDTGATPPGAQAPTTAGRQGELVNDAADARRAPGAVQAPETGGRTGELQNDAADAARGPGSVDAPVTAGRQGELENDAADATRAPGEVVYPDATGRARVDGGDRQLGLGEDADALPPPLDLGDPVTAVKLARAMQAADGNGFDMAFEYWVNAILSGPQTHIANIAGNSVNAALDLTLQRGVEAFLNAGLSRIGLGDQNAPQFGEFAHMIRGIRPGFTRALTNALKAWDAEAAMFENDVLNRQVAMDLGKVETPKTAIPGQLGRVVRIPGRSLLFMDEFFKGLIGQMQVGSEAYRIAKGEGLSGEQLERRITGLVNLPGSEAWERAAAKATELTFQSDFDEGSFLGKVGGAVQNARQSIPGLRYFVPFLRTVMNIFGLGLRKSPLGSINFVQRFARHGLYRLNDGAILARPYERPEAIKHAAEQLIAWAMTAALVGAAEGDDDDDKKAILVTGSRPYDPSKRGVAELERRTGMDAYMIRIGGAQFSYARYEPVATMLGVAVDALKTIKQRDRREAGALYGSMAKAISEQVTSKTFAQGLDDLSKIVQDPTRALVDWTANFGASWVPNVVRQIARNADEKVRETSVEAKPGELTARLVESVGKRILPGTAEPKIDARGQVVTKPGNAVSRQLVPGATGEAPAIDRVDRMLLRWKAAHPDDAWAPAAPGRRIEINGQPYYMTDEELRKYRETSGQIAGRILNGLTFNVEKPTENDIERVKKAYEVARAQARRMLFSGKVVDKK